jgi:hypothetical protein
LTVSIRLITGFEILPIFEFLSSDLSVFP